MSSPAPSVSSADEEARELAELKAKHEAELREAAERKARKDQEHRERCEHEKREKKEREAREEITRRIQEVGKAVAEVAQGLAETEQEQEEREQEALRRMWTNDASTEAEVGITEGTGEGGSGDDKGPSSGATEAKSEEEADLTKIRSPRREIIVSRQNTVEVIIVRPPKKGKGSSEQTGGDQVSPASFGRGSELMMT